MQNKRAIFMYFLLFAITFLSQSKAEELPRLTIIPEISKGAYRPGDTVLVAIKILIPKNYHFYDNPMGPGLGKPMTYSVDGSEAIEWLDLLKTKSKKYKPEIGDWVNAFEGEQCFFLRGIVNKSVTSGTYQSKLSISGLICHDACLPVDENVKIIANISNESTFNIHFENNQSFTNLLTKTRLTQKLESPANLSGISVLSDNLSALNVAHVTTENKSYNWNYAPQDTSSDFNLFLAIFFAFLAGVILNAMPCVLPVLGVKILSFAQASGMDRRKAIIHSLAFAAGVIAVFLLLAVLASFANYSWGKQFQDPRALIAIIAIIIVFALGLFDVYMINISGSAKDTDNKNSIFNDFTKGIFATILATPCSGPFLGAVLAWLLTQPPYVIFVVYASIGLGMSSPYVLLSSIPALTKILPKPGGWMNDFKMFMGFLLIVFAVYLMIGLPQDLIVPTVLFCVLIAFTVVLYTRLAPWGSSVKIKFMSILISTIVASSAFYFSFMILYPSFSKSNADISTENEHVWQDFNADSLIAAHNQGRPVILDFTANWCMNCQYNFIMVLSKKEITDRIREKNILALKVDMTSPNPLHDSLLKSLGSQSIPFLALFSGDKPYEPIVMRDVLQKGKVKKAIDEL